MRKLRKSHTPLKIGWRLLNHRRGAREKNLIRGTQHPQTPCFTSNLREEIHIALQSDKHEGFARLGLWRVVGILCFPTAPKKGRKSEGRGEKGGQPTGRYRGTKWKCVDTPQEDDTRGNLLFRSRNLCWQGGRLGSKEKAEALNNDGKETIDSGLDSEAEAYKRSK